MTEKVEQLRNLLKFGKDWEGDSKRFYEAAYDTGKYFPRNGYAVWKQIFQIFPKFTKGLDVGCGPGTGVRAARINGMDVYGVDIADNTKLWTELGINEFCQQAPAHRLPFKDKEFDMVICTEVLEHIPEEGVQDSLNEIYRVGSDKYIISASCAHENYPLLGEVHTHITIKPIAWWMDKFKKAGFNIADAKAIYDDEAKTKDRGIIIVAVRDNMPYALGQKKLTKFGNMRSYTIHV